MAQNNLQLKLEKLLEYIEWFFSLKNKKLINRLTKEWALVCRMKFISRKSHMLPTSGRLEKAIYFSENSTDGLRYDFRVLKRDAQDRYGGVVRDYVEVLMRGYAGGKASMGTWLPASKTGRKIDAQLVDWEGRPMGTHPGMLPKMPAAIKDFHIRAEKIIIQQYMEGVNKILR